MLSFPQFSSPEEKYKYDESLKVLQEDNRVMLPADTAEIFAEEQNFDQAWVWLLLGVVTLGVFVSLVMAGQWGLIMLLAGAVLVSSMTLMASFKLYTKIDSEGVHYHANPFQWKNKTIRWDEIDQIYVRKYSPLLEYGGWGIRYGRSGWAYIAKGNQGIQMVLKNGKKILLGTQQGEEVTRLLEHRSLTV
ncbi:MAG: hypothetical protein WBB31_05850 [Saprospiraceae bacterium]